MFAAASSGALICGTGNLSTVLQLAGWILVNTLVFTACVTSKVRTRHGKEDEIQVIRGLVQ